MEKAKLGDGSIFLSAFNLQLSTYFLSSTMEYSGHCHYLSHTDIYTDTILLALPELNI